MDMSRQDDNEPDFFISKTHGDWTSDLSDVRVFTQVEKQVRKLNLINQTWVDWTSLMRDFECSKMTHPTNAQFSSKLFLLE